MKDKYNILLITSDQQHFDTIGKFNKEIKTFGIKKNLKNLKMNL